MDDRPVTIWAIRLALAREMWVLTAHARRQLGTRDIDLVDLLQCLAAAEVVEDYPTDPRGASALLLGHTLACIPLHVVCSFDPSGTLLIITAYVPELPRWLDERTRAR